MYFQMDTWRVIRRLHTSPVKLTNLKPNKSEKQQQNTRRRRTFIQRRKMAESNQTQCTAAEIKIDSATALQKYLDRIPVSSISGIKSTRGTTLHFLFSFSFCTQPVCFNASWIISFNSFPFVSHSF